MPENIFLDGQGSFNHSTKNAGTIKWGEFNNAAVNTGAIVLSAVFTGTAVNSGTIGDLMPVYATSVFKANSGNWESTYSTVQSNSATWGQGGGGSSDWDSITNKPTEFNPSAHTHAVSSVNGLQPVVTWVASNSSAPAIINYIFDNGTAPILANTKGNITLPSGFKITEWQVLSDLVTTSTLYLNKATFDSYPTMTFYGEMALSNGRKASGSFTGVDNLSANDILEFSVITNSASTKLTISIKGYKI